MQGGFLLLLTGSTALRFTATGAPTRLTDESVCLAADNVRNDVVTVHRSQEVLRMLPLYTRYPSQLIVSLNNTDTTIRLALAAHQTQTFPERSGLRGLDVDCVNSSSDYFAYLCIPASETTRHQKRMSIADRSHLRRQSIETSCKNEPC
jgi:hypothetical protein